MSEYFAILADDLTGAGDCGVEFVRVGLRTRALLGSWRAGALAGVDVVVVNTESRALPPSLAYSLVRAAAHRLVANRVQVVYKKVDSTLRGPIGAEVEAVMDGCGVDLAVVCPALPAAGRTVVDGHLLVDGTPVTRTAGALDPVTPVYESHIPTLLAGQVQRPVYQAGAMARGIEGLVRTLQERRTGLIVCDAVDEADLSLIADAVFQARVPVLFVGSAGLARPVAARLASGRARAIRAWPLATGPDRGSVLLACASLNPVTRVQIETLAASGAVWTVVLDGASALAGDEAWSAWQEKAAQELVSHARTARALIVATPAVALSGELAPVAAPRRLAEAAAELVTRVLEAVLVCGVVATGGDMAAALLDHWQAAGIDLASEVLPGMPMGTVYGGNHAGLPIVTKAGGFGGPNMFVQAMAEITVGTHSTSPACSSSNCNV